MATYDEIKADVKARDKKSVKSCWIADIKRKNSLPVRRAWNRKTPRANPCPKTMRRPIEDALRRAGDLK
jgi:hypothetical protein